MIHTAVILLISTCLVMFAQAPQAGASAPGSELRGYILGPEDQIEIHAVDVDEIPVKPIKVDPSGNIDLTLVGTIHVAGKTKDELREELVSRLRKFVKEPMVSVSVVEFHSRGVAVLGAVANPGMRQVEGPRTLLDVIAMAGGIRTDAGSTVTISRPKESGQLPLQGTRTLLGNGDTVASLNVYRLMSARYPEENIRVLPGDVITVAEPEKISVWGEVKKPGTFPLLPSQGMTVMRALALAEGPQRTAAQKNAFILRTEGQGLMSKHIATDLAAIMNGTKPDVPMEPSDVLVIPNNAPRNAALRGLETAIQIGTGILIFHR